MAKTIFKYTLTDPKNTFTMPAGARVLHVAEQSSFICLWAEVDPDVDKTKDRTFCIVGTGRDIPDGAWYHGTILDGPFVWHIYEVGEDDG